MKLISKIAFLLICTSPSYFNAIDSQEIALTYKNPRIKLAPVFLDNDTNPRKRFDLEKELEILTLQFSDSIQWKGFLTSLLPQLNPGVKSATPPISNEDFATLIQLVNKLIDKIEKYSFKHNTDVSHIFTTLGILIDSKIEGYKPYEHAQSYHLHKEGFNYKKFKEKYKVAIISSLLSAALTATVSYCGYKMYKCNRLIKNLGTNQYFRFSEIQDCKESCATGIGILWLPTILSWFVAGCCISDLNIPYKERLDALLSLKERLALLLKNQPADAQSRIIVLNVV